MQGLVGTMVGLTLVGRRAVCCARDWAAVVGWKKMYRRGRGEIKLAELWIGDWLDWPSSYHKRISDHLR